MGELITSSKLLFHDWANAQLGLLKSSHGHDAFLIDMEALNEMVVSFRQKQ